jgi:hypothetical protein
VLAFPGPRRNILYQAGVLTAVWSKMTNYIKAPFVTSIMTKETSYAYTDNINIDPADFFRVDLPQTIKIIIPEQYIGRPIIFTTSQNAGSVVYGCFPELRTVFMAVLAAGNIIQWYTANKKENMPIIPVIEDRRDTFEDFKTYVRTRNPRICQKYSGFNQTVPAKSLALALDRMPWDKISISKNTTLDCLNLQRILVGYDPVDRALVVDSTTRKKKWKRH